MSYCFITPLITNTNNKLCNYYGYCNNNNRLIITNYKKIIVKLQHDNDNDEEERTSQKSLHNSIYANNTSTDDHNDNKITLDDAIKKSKALPISRLRNALDRRGIDCSSLQNNKKELQLLYANALYNNIPLQSTYNRINIDNIINDINDDNVDDDDNNNKRKTTKRIKRQKPKYDVSKINNRYKKKIDPTILINKKRKEQIKNYIDKTKYIAKTSTKILFIKGTQLLKNYKQSYDNEDIDDDNFQWKNAATDTTYAEYAYTDDNRNNIDSNKNTSNKQNRVRMNRNRKQKNNRNKKSSSKLLLLPPCATPTFPFTSSSSTSSTTTNTGGDATVKVYNTTKYYRQKRRRRNQQQKQQRHRNTIITLSKKEKQQKENNMNKEKINNEENTSSSNKNENHETSSNKPPNKKKKKHRYWKDKLNEQMDYAFGLHIDEEYNKWIKQKEIDNENIKPLADIINPIKKKKRKKELNNKKAFWDDEGSILNLIFGRIPKQYTSQKQQQKQKIKELNISSIKNILKNYENNVNIMTILFRTTFQQMLIFISIICRWASVRNALPQPIVVLAFVTSVLCAPKGKRLLSIIITLIICRTIAEALHGYIYDDWDNDDDDYNEDDASISSNSIETKGRIDENDNLTNAIPNI